MPDPTAESGRIERQLNALEYQVRRSSALHGLYAAVGLLVGLLLPVAQVQFNQDDVPERYTLLGLVFALNSDYEVDHPTLVVLAAAGITVTTLIAIGAFLIAAGRQDRTAATVALAASPLLLPLLLLANYIFGVTDVDIGATPDPLEGWAAGCWVLLFGALASCWIATFLREQLDR